MRNSVTRNSLRFDLIEACCRRRWEGILFLWNFGLYNHSSIIILHSTEIVFLIRQKANTLLPDCRSMYTLYARLMLMLPFAIRHRRIKAEFAFDRPLRREKPRGQLCDYFIGMGELYEAVCHARAFRKSFGPFENSVGEYARIRR